MLAGASPAATINMEKRYTSLTPIQLAAEPQFISWIYEGTGDTEWREWIAANPHMEPIAQEARLIVNDLKQSQVYKISEGEKNDLWNRIEASVHPIQHAQREHAHNKQTRRRSIVRSVLAVAATLALIIWITLPKSEITTSIGAAEQKTITLPDQSSVTINAGSVVSYLPNKYDKKRTVKLDGEAFFEVEKGEQFIVETPCGSVTVLGTSFNVVARKDRFEVSCYTGKVKVENNKKQSQLLTPGQKALEQADHKTLSMQPFTAMDIKPEWTKGKFVFTGQSLRVVADELERQYAIQVLLEPGLDDLQYVGFFESGDLQEAVSLITWPLHLEAQIKNNAVSIARKR
jgi:transmembrane sensor